MKQTSHYSQRGFTLVEIMIVVVIVGLLAMLAIPAYQKLQRSSAGRAMVLDAHNIGLAAQQMALDHPKAVKNGAVLTIFVSRDGALSNAVFGAEDDMIPADQIVLYVKKVTPGTVSPIIYTFGTGNGERAFTMKHPRCAPSDVAPTSEINLSTTLGNPVQFDEDGKAL